jgi:hypothetical protein
MNTPFNPPANSEDRFEAWLSAQPLTPRPDFVARTIKRIHDETALVTSARAGDEAAVDILLDRWLGEQPLQPEFEADQLVIQTRREATREEQEESRPKKSAPWLIPFPAWARSAAGIAAAAGVVFAAYFTTQGPIADIAATTSVAQNESTLPANWPTQGDALVRISEGLRGGSDLLDSNNMVSSDDVEAMANIAQDYGNGEILN